MARIDHFRDALKVCDGQRLVGITCLWLAVAIANMRDVRILNDMEMAKRDGVQGFDFGDPFASEKLDELAANSLAFPSLNDTVDNSAARAAGLAVCVGVHVQIVNGLTQCFGIVEDRDDTCWEAAAGDGC